MNICSSCFNSETGPATVIAVRPSIARCDFCGQSTQQAWPTSAFAEPFLLLIDAYQPATPATDGAEPLHKRLQDDWGIFTFPDDASHTRVADFLDDSLRQTRAPYERTALFESLVPGGHDREWDSFVREVTETNRYFPRKTLDLDFLAQMIEENVATLAEGTPLFRARVHSEPRAFPSDEMGRPPAGKVTPGRANPLGIAHLYVALSEETAIRESRATQHLYVSVATLTVQETCNVLKLGSLDRDNPFRGPDDLAKRLDYWRLLSRLGTELSKPARSVDNRVEYVPSQYLSEFVKSRGYDGILYGSSLHPDGTNIVLFSDAKVHINPTVQCFEIIAQDLEWQPA